VFTGAAVAALADRTAVVAEVEVPLVLLPHAARSAALAMSADARTNRRPAMSAMLVDVPIAVKAVASTLARPLHSEPASASAAAHSSLIRFEAPGRVACDRRSKLVRRR